MAEEKKKRQHIVVQDSVHKELKIKAAEDEVKIQDLANTLLKKQLGIVE